MSRVPETTVEHESTPQAGVRASDTAPRHDSPAVPGQRALAPANPQDVLGLNRRDRRVLMVLIVVAVGLMSVQWYRLTHQRPEPIAVLHPQEYRFLLDVNTATWVEWMQLDGVGETMARRIVEDRRLRGPFQSVEDVQRVKGIGPKTLGRLREHLACPSAAHDAED